MKTAILFTGSTSTGKTTLLKCLQEHFIQKDVPVSVITEFVRELKSRGVINCNDIEGNDYTQNIITSEQMLQYFEKIYDENNILIAERTPIDILAYCRNSDVSDYTKECAERYLKALFSCKDVNFFIFYFPLVIPYEEDSVRIKEGYKIIDSEILNILCEYNISYIDMCEGSVEERKQYVLKITNLV